MTPMPRHKLDSIEAMRGAVREIVAWERYLGGFMPSMSLSNETPSREPTAAVVEPVVNAEQIAQRLQVLRDQASQCTRCELHTGRTKSVFSRGSQMASLAFVGEGPGYNEDQQGEPFVGRAGKLLDKMIQAMGYRPDEVYICNVVKCRPPENRTPLPNEAHACLPFLQEQLSLVAPKVIVALGKCAVEYLECMPPSGRGWRGSWNSWSGIDVMPTYHPAFLLRSPQFKKVVWEDLQRVIERLKA